MLAYFLKVNVAIVLFYAFYRLFFYKTRFSAGAEPHCSASLPFLPPYLC